jgi:hypothetical protein
MKNFAEFYCPHFLTKQLQKKTFKFLAPEVGQEYIVWARQDKTPC